MFNKFKGLKDKVLETFSFKKISEIADVEYKEKPLSYFETRLELAKEEDLKNQEEGKLESIFKIVKKALTFDRKDLSDLLFDKFHQELSKDYKNGIYKEDGTLKESSEINFLSSTIVNEKFDSTTLVLRHLKGKKVEITADNINLLLEMYKSSINENNRENKSISKKLIYEMSYIDPTIFQRASLDNIKFIKEDMPMMNREINIEESYIKCLVKNRDRGALDEYVNSHDGKERDLAIKAILSKDSLIGDYLGIINSHVKEEVEKRKINLKDVEMGGFNQLTSL